jgi:iron complex outermembrane recepter protein
MTIKKKETRMFKKSTISSAVAAMLASSISVQTLAAEEAETDANDGEDVKLVITGIRGSIGRARDTKRDASGVLDSISTEDIGKFPDQNLAESLQRITGVSIDRSGGEGQFITVRGFGPQFNTVLVNGRQIASEDTSRAFSFDTLAAEMVSGIYVHKTSTATTQSGGIGSTINVTTARPFDLHGFKAVGSVKAHYDGNSEESTPEVFGLVSNTFNNNTLGLLLSLSHKETNTRLNQAQTDGWLENVGIPQAQLNGGAGFAGNIFSPRNYDSKVTFEERTRTNANLVLQYAPQNNLVLTADVAYSDFDIETDATSYGHWFTAPNIENAVTDANGTVIDLYQEVGLATDFHAKKFDRLTETKSFGLNAEWEASDSLILNFDYHKSEATREPNNGGGDQLSLIGYANRVRFQSDDAVLPWVSDFQAPRANIVDGDGVSRPVSDYLDPANGRAHVMLRRGWAVEDEVDQFRMDGVWDEGNSSLTSVKFGVMYSSETKSLQRWDNEGVGIHCTFCNYPNSPDIPDNFLTLFDAGSDFLSGVSGSGRTPAQWLQHDGEQQFAYLEGISGLSFDAVLRDNSFDIEEKTIAAYMEFTFEAEVAEMPLTVTSGVRYEATDVSVDGTEAPIEGLTILDQTEMLASFGAASPISASDDYSYLLPNLNVNLEISDQVIARFGASRTLTRPTLSDMAPVTNIGTTRQGGDLTASSGNPALKPFTSDNIDLSLEWYYKDDSYMSVGYFLKNVSNFIVQGTQDQTFVTSNGSLLTDPSTGTDTGAPDASDSVAVFTTTLPNNGEEAEVNGLEFALQHTFTDTGFGTLFNLTLVDSDSDLDVADITQKFAVTGLSDSMNLVGFYEQGPFQFRLAYNFRDEFLQSLRQSNGDGVTFVDEYEQWDMSGSYDINDNFTVFFEVTNLTEEVVTKHGRFNNHFLLAEDAGRRFALGLSANF